MTSPSAKEKGDALELAVRAIEASILRTFPGFAEDTFTIEGKKIVTHAGVRHEIDVFVTVRHGSGYDSVFIFECKNWQDKVSKNEIIVFSEKVKAVSAQRGFFVAPSFTSDAESQAALDPRMELLKASEVDLGIAMAPLGFHSIHVELPKVSIQMHAAGKRGDGTLVEKRVDAKSTVMVFRGANTDANQFLLELVTSLRDERVSQFHSVTAPAGTHTLDVAGARDFIESELTVNNVPIKRIEITGTVDVVVCRPVAVSALEVATRGRHITVQMRTPIGDVQAGFVQLEAPPPTV